MRAYEMKTDNALKQSLQSGTFTVTTEIGPPRHCGGDYIQQQGRMLALCADAINITDNQTAIARLSSLAGCVLLQAVGVDPVLQMTCRDRNRIALQSDVLGAASLGINTILCLTGDHQKFGNHPEAKNVFDLDSIQLIAMIKAMRDEGKFLSGDEIKVKPDIFIGCAANPFADPVELRVLRLEKKINAGAEFIQTQPVLEIDRFQTFMEMAAQRGLTDRAYVLAGIMPIKSARMARYMQKNVPGMLVSESICKQFERSTDIRQTAIDLAVEQIKIVKQISGVAGVHIMAVAWEEIIPEIVDRAGLYPRTRAVPRVAP